MTPEEQAAHDMSMQLEGARKERSAWIKYFKRRKKLRIPEEVAYAELSMAQAFGANRHDRYLKAKG